MSTKSPDTRLTIRLTPEERQALKVRAGDQALSAYLRETVLEQSASKRKQRKTAPIKDHVALARVLALLGGHRLVEQFRAIERDVTNGVDATNDETLALLDECRDFLSKIHSALMRALGIKEQ